MMSSVWLLACTVMSSTMLSLSSSRVLSSKMANGLLLCVCCWWTGHKSQMFTGAVGSCNVVGIQVGVLVGREAIERGHASTLVTHGGNSCH